MGKKKGNKGGGDGRKTETKSKGEGENKKKDGENGVTVVLKVDMHCGSCADKIVKLARSIEGVEKVKADWEANKLTVQGDMDPSDLLEELQEKARRKVELVSPELPKKEKDKTFQPPVTTAVLKLELHCAGCIDKIHKIAAKTKGVQSIAFDKDNDLVAVMGAMDVKALVESLSEKINRPIQVVQPKKDKDGGGAGVVGGKKNKEGGGNGGEDEGEDKGAEDIEDDGSDRDGAEEIDNNGAEDDDDDGAEEIYGGKEESDDDGAEEIYRGAGEYFGGNRMEYSGIPSGLPLPGYGYDYGYNYRFMYGNNLHAPQMFSDDNPNACHVM